MSVEQAMVLLSGGAGGVGGGGEGHGGILVDYLMSMDGRLHHSLGQMLLDKLRHWNNSLSVNHWLDLCTTSK